MFKSYLAIAFKHLVKQKLHSAINVVGLSIGLACFILIALFVQHELSYDRHFANADRIYRISRDFFSTANSSEARLATIAPQAAALLAEDFPEIETVARIRCCGSSVATNNGEVFRESGFAEADNQVFEIFDFEWLQGQPTTALAEPYTIVLTRSAALRYFGRTEAVGETLLLENRWPITVTGVIEDLPDRTHLNFTMLSSLLTTAAVYGEGRLNNWSFNQYHTYVRLAEGTDTGRIESQSGEFFERHFAQGSSEFTGLVSMALTDIHLRSSNEGEMGTPGSIATVYTFAAIAVFILLIACISFMNLATARSTQRAKEIGVRKAMGAERGQVVWQFLFESVLMVLVAVLLAATFVELALPAFASFLEMDLLFDYLGDPRVAIALVALTLGIGLAAGSYPAFYLSAFSPDRVLKGDLSRGDGAVAFRRVLVALQFSISIALLIATAVVYQQMQFARNVELGYNKDQIVVVSAPTAGFGASWETLKREWLAYPQITNVTASLMAPFQNNTNAMAVRAEGRDSAGGGVPFLWVDYDFFETYGIEPIAGRTFSEDFGSDRLVVGAQAEQTRGAYVINEHAARQYGWTPEEAVGKWLELVPGRNRGPVVGVVEDVYLESVHNAIKPMVYLIPPAAENIVSVIGYVPLLEASLRITGRDLENTLAFIDAAWSALVPGQPISRRFLNQDFEALYRSEQRQSQMFTLFSALAIFIACFGLFGLASFATEQRTKEIGIRKVVGGTALDIVRLFTGEIGRLVLIANVVAWPVAYVLMRRWLENFAYRIDMNVLSFAGSGLLALVVALLTVGAIAARAAATKPIHSLRYE
jgi:putative ABC transport system permease protein